MSIKQILPSNERLRRENERLRAKCAEAATQRNILRARIKALEEPPVGAAKEKARKATKKLEEALATIADLRKINSALEKEIARIIRAHALRDSK